MCIVVSPGALLSIPSTVKCSTALCEAVVIVLYVQCVASDKVLCYCKRWQKYVINDQYSLKYVATVLSF